MSNHDQHRLLGSPPRARRAASSSLLVDITSVLHSNVRILACPDPRVVSNRRGLTAAFLMGQGLSLPPM
jgi:hypothetical protein